MRIFVDMDGTIVQTYPDTCQRYRTPGYFRDLPPYESALDAVRLLIKSGIDVYIISTVYTMNAFPEKDAWLDRHLPELPMRKRIYVPENTPKATYVPGGVHKDDILFDDYTYNLLEWPGIGIKAANGINGNKGQWRGPCVSVYDAHDLLSLMKERRFIWTTTRIR